VSDFPYYLHEKAEESRHSESIGILIAIIGSVFLVGGFLQTLLTMEQPLLSPVSLYQLWSSPYGFLGFSFTILGVILFLSGLILAVHYASHRSWYCNALKERYKTEEEELKAAQKKSKGKQPELIPTVAAEESSPADLFEQSESGKQVRKKT
jgi:hypothetical protein